MATEKLIHYLNQNQVPYELMHHFESFTAQETAAFSHVKGREFAKTVIVNLDGELVFTVLPAHYKVDLKRLKELTGAHRAAIAQEEEFSYSFPDCTAGAMPPFGNLYHMPVIIDSDLVMDEEIAFNAGTHTEAIKMAKSDYMKLVHPKVASIHRRPHRGRM